MKITSKVATFATILGLLIATPYFVPTVTNAQNTQQRKVQAKRRIAVLDFEFSTTGLTGSQFSVFGVGGPSKGVSDLITNSLVKDGTYTIIERSRIDQILKEQNLGASGRIEAATAAQIGRALGADVLIIGSVTRFNLESNTSGGSFLGFGSTTTSSVAEVKLTARFVSTTTGEIVAVAEGEGKADQSDSSVSIGGLGGGGSTTSNTDKLLSSAAEKAVSQIVTQLSGAAPKLAALPAVLPNVTALVADVTGNLVTINKGGRDGFTVGMIVSVERLVKQVKDPVTGKVLRSISNSVGRVQLTEVDGSSAVGKIIKGGGFGVGDLAKPVE